MAAMRGGRKRRRLRRSAGAVVLSLLSVGLGPVAGSASASGPPQLGAAWSFAVLNDSAHLAAEVNPNGLSTAYHFDYIANSAYEANLAAAKEGFSGASKAPAVVDVNIGAGTSYVKASQVLPGLPAATAYRYRIVAHNGSGTTNGSPRLFITQPPPGATLLDGRGWEMVSPVQKNGGQLDAPESIAGGGVFQAAAPGGAVTYSSTASFAGGQGAPPASQYLATRTASGWSTQNVTQPIFSGTYDAEEGGGPYRLFSSDLSRALLLNGDHCRGEGGDCAVANPPLLGTDAPEGYQDYYLRQGGSFTALLGTANSGFLSLDPSHFDLSLAGSTPDLGHAVLSSCAKLTSNAVEVPAGEGCDPAKQNLYEWSGAGLSLVNLLPGEAEGTPGAALAAPSGAISEDGARVYFEDQGALYLREGAQTKLLATGGEFQAASTNGAIAYYTKPDEHLYRYEAAGAGASADITPSGEVKGVLGASASGDTVYYQDGNGLKRWHSGTTATVASGSEAAEEGDWPPATGASRVSSNGVQLLFLSKESLTGYDNTDLNTGEPDSELFLYDGSLRCVSCNPTGERPIGPSSIPGAIANGSGPGSTRIYKPRVLSANGRRVFFESTDALALTDANVNHTTGAGIADAYEWEAQGEGNCTGAGGCVALVSSGKDPGGATLLDASADGGDIFFLTAASLISADPGSVDLYDARVGGGFAEPSPPLACEGDACQPLPSQPVDPTLDTLLSGPGNPPVRYPGVHCKKHFVKRRGECVRKEGKSHHMHRKHKERHQKRGGRR